MAIRTIARMFDSYADATAAVRDLEAAGFLHDDISLVGSQAETEGTDQVTTETSTGAGTGATLGTLVGGGAGLLAGLGTLAIPGLGPIVAAGWLIATLTGAGVGAAAGGLLGGLTGAGVSEDEAHVYAEGVRRGGTLVTVRADETRANEAEHILAKHNPVDVGTRGGEYRAGGWTGYDENAPAMRSAGIGARSAPGGVPDDGRIMPRQPDGTPGNPPGTMLSRGVDQAAGTNISGAHPENETRTGSSSSGTLGGTSSGTLGGTLGSRDGTPGNPPGTMASRGVDQAAGTNISGAYPGNETRRSAPGGVPDDGKLIPDQPDGAPGNPPGTKLSRGIDEVAGTNISGAHPENEAGDVRNPQGERIGRTADRVLGTDRTPRR